MLNLGVEGMMLAGAIAAFATANVTGITSLGILAALVGRHRAGAAVRGDFADLAGEPDRNRAGADHFRARVQCAGRRRLCRHPGTRRCRSCTFRCCRIFRCWARWCFRMTFWSMLSLAILAVVAWCIRSTHLGLIIPGGRRLARRGACAGLFRGADPLCGGGVWRRAGRAGRRLYVARLYAALGAGHDRRPRLGRGGAGHIFGLAAVLAADRRLVLRRTDVSVAVRAGAGGADPVGVAFGVARISARSSCWC